MEEITAFNTTSNIFPSEKVMGVDLDRAAEINGRIKALIVDDEADTVSLIKLLLIKSGLDAAGAFSGIEALQKCSRFQPDVILLDIMMPDMDGWQTFEHLRQITTAPVIFVSAKAQEDDVVKGLTMGGDDYISKPYRPRELVARIHTVLRRIRKARPTQIYRFPKSALELDPDNQEVIIQGKRFALQRKTFEVLMVLAKHVPNFVSKEKIAMEVWGEANAEAIERIKYQIFLMRQALEENPDDPKLIISRKRLGYRLAVE